MQRARGARWRLSFFRVAFGACLLAAMQGTAGAACDFSAVKLQIDVVLDRDAARGEKFRREVASGADSIAVLESLVAPEMAKKIDICRFETAEYLTKRGFPPFH
ncbi:MAG: hypothetical protein K2Z80_21590 [Xanthobacteraceae bacterium]|nr:hypothetical protein [Xanthobacteraceae bacterium]